MHDVNILVRVDEQADEPNVTVALTVDGQPVAHDTAGPAAWRDLLAPARALLGADADAALAAVEQAIAVAVAERKQRGAEQQRRRTAAEKAWTAALDPVVAP